MNRPDILPADPAYRKKVIKILLISAIAGFLILAVLSKVIDKQVESGDPGKLIGLMTLLIALMVTGLTGYSIYLVRIAIKTKRQAQFPPPGMKVIRDTPILYDDAARQRAKQLIVFAALIIGSSFMMLRFFLRFLDTLG